MATSRPVFATILVAGIFIAEIVTDLEIDFAVFYVVVLLIAVGFAADTVFFWFLPDVLH